MRLAREDELHGPGRVGDEALEALGVLEQQVGPLVRGETAGEADGQGFGVQHVVRHLELPAPAAPGHDLLLEPFPHEVDEPLA
ncbi:hypothetical protein DSECCO2_498720 [anaerobic digester metagenome]